MTYEALARAVDRPCPEPRRSAVLVPVVEEPEGLSLLFELRSPFLHTQPGEVCFPGGRVEAGEAPVTAVLRETAEELGLGPEWVELGPALPVCHHRMGSQTLPFLGRLRRGWREELRFNEAEVAEIFTVPLDFFRRTPPELYSCKLATVPPADFPYEKIGFPQGYPWATGESQVPIWLWEGRAIWGLTGRIILSLVEQL